MESYFDGFGGGSVVISGLDLTLSFLRARLKFVRMFWSVVISGLDLTLSFLRARLKFVKMLWAVVIFTSDLTAATRRMRGGARRENE
jgi:hypothetical protein